MAFLKLYQNMTSSKLYPNIASLKLNQNMYFVNIDSQLANQQSRFATILYAQNGHAGSVIKIVIY
jgi:hypothetical protein